VKKYLAIVFVAALGAATSAYAQIWTESGDAGDLPGTAQSATGVGSLTDIFGSVSLTSDADIYRIYISSPAAFSATTNISPLTMSDTTLYLFNLDGTGIAKNDDISSSNYLSNMPVGAPQYSSLAPGEYLLAVGGFAYAPYYTGPSTLADLVFDVNTFTGVLGPQAGPLGCRCWVGSMPATMTAAITTSP